MGKSQVFCHFLEIALVFLFADYAELKRGAFEQMHSSKQRSEPLSLVVVPDKEELVG